MAAPTNQELLDDVLTAIQSIVQGKNVSASEGARAMTRLSINDLYKLKNKLEDEIANAANPQVFFPLGREY